MSCVALNHKQPVNQAVKRRREPFHSGPFKCESEQVDNTATFSKTGVIPAPILRAAVRIFKLARIILISLVKGLRSSQPFTKC